MVGFNNLYYHVSLTHCVFSLIPAEVALLEKSITWLAPLQKEKVWQNTDTKSFLLHSHLMHEMIRDLYFTSVLLFCEGT